MDEPEPKGVADSRLRIHYRNGRHETVPLTMVCLARAERFGISPRLQANAYYLAAAHAALRASGADVGDDFEAWADDADPVLIERIDGPDDPT